MSQIMESLATRMDNNGPRALRDVRQYTEVLTALGRAGLGQEAADLLHEMRRQGVCLSIIHYNAGISAYVKCKSWVLPFELLQEISLLGYQPPRSKQIPPYPRLLGH